jgi:hypothetical protein
VGDAVDKTVTAHHPCVRAAMTAAAVHATELAPGTNTAPAPAGDTVSTTDADPTTGGIRDVCGRERSLVVRSFLAKSNWVYPTKLRWLPETQDFRISGLAIMGDHPDFEPIEFDAARPLADQRLYLVSHGREPIPLVPFCMLADCPSCLTPELYYPDRLGPSTAMLKSLDRGHELESPAVFNALRSWMNP